MRPTHFRSVNGNIPLPVFFPDATRAVVKTVDSVDIKNTGTPGILVNTYHLYKGLGKKILRKYGGVRDFMGWKGAVISDSGGFQVMSLIKKNPNRGRVTDKGAIFHPVGEEKVELTPEKSVEFQMELKPDMVVDCFGKNTGRIVKFFSGGVGDIGNWISIGSDVIYIGDDDSFWGNNWKVINWN